MSTLILICFTLISQLSNVHSQQPFYDVELYSMSSEPVISNVLAKGKGYSPCLFTFNPAYIEISPLTNTSGLLLRVAKCPPEYGGHKDHIMYAPCDLLTGICGDLINQTIVASYTEDPRVVYDKTTNTYYNFYWSQNTNQSKQGTVDFAADKGGNPYNSNSWKLLNILNWNRNGCLIIRNTTPHYAIYGVSPPAHGLSIAITNDLVNFTTINATLLKCDSSQQEVVIEAGTPPIVIPKTGDYFHLYAAGTNGWIPNGNYTAGYIILDKNNPAIIKQKSKKHILIPTYPYQIGMGAPYPTQRNRTIFASTAVHLPDSFANDTDVWDYIRVWFGALDANVGTAVIRIKKH